jgi:hypothetical protein
MSALKYAWQQAVSDAFEASAESLPATINAAEITIAARLLDPNEPDAFERVALDKALRSLKELVKQARPHLVPERVSHFHIRWSSGAVDFETHSTRADAEAVANILVLPNEKYAIEEYGSDCPRCRNLARRKIGA